MHILYFDSLLNIIFVPSNITDGPIKFNIEAAV
jgi:hypothetical protein